MEWYIVLLVMFGVLLVLMASGMPIAMSFIIFNIAGAILLWGGRGGIEQITLNMLSSVANFTLLPIVMFVLLGELLFRSGMAMQAIDVLDRMLGKLPGRLAILSVGAGTLFATMTGATSASVAMLGEVLVPEMEKRGYNRGLSMGTIMGSGGLAMLIPPSTYAILWGVIAEVSIGKLLIAIVIPGLLVAVSYAVYVVGICAIKPSLAPNYDVKHATFSEQIIGLTKYVLPLGLIVFAVTGMIFIGVSTPEEAAILGVIACILLAAIYRKLNWKVIKDSLISTLLISVMILLIVSGAKAYAHIMAFTGSVQGFSQAVLGLALNRTMIIVGMMLILLVLGCFLNGLTMMMITLPIFMPIIRSIHFDVLAFAVMFLISVEVGNLTPPFGPSLFVMKAVAPKGTTMTQIINAGVPFIICDMVIIGLIMVFPILASWLPGLMFTG